MRLILHSSRVWCADFLGAYTLLLSNKMPINNSKSLTEKYADADFNAVKSYERNEGRDECEDKLGKLIVQLALLERYDDVKKDDTQDMNDKEGKILEYC
jgi:hypothetical protein